jgi:serine protease
MFTLIFFLFNLFLLVNIQNLKLTLAVDQQPAVWGLDRIVPPLDKVYSYKYDGTGVKAFIMDTGIQISHSEFNGRASCGYSAFDDGCRDNHGHGTHVAGTVGGAKYGVAKNVELISVKVYDIGGGNTGTWYAGLDYIFGEKMANPTVPMVINLSMGSNKDDGVNERIDQVILAGITTVVSAGNQGSNACDYTPASVKRAIAVGATTRFDEAASFSNFGQCVDILAPGTNIKSAAIGSDSNTVRKSGTSMASPHVAGVAVLHLSKNASLTPRQVLGRLKGNSLRYIILMKPVVDTRDKTPNFLLSVGSLLQ